MHVLGWYVFREKQGLTAELAIGSQIVSSPEISRYIESTSYFKWVVVGVAYSEGIG
jgi:hypothetical protein